MIKKVVKILLAVIPLSMLAPVAYAEELYTLVNANGQLISGATLVCSDAVCGPNGSFSTNPATMSQIATNYNCSPGPCTFVRVDNQTRLPIGTSPTPTPTPAPTPTPSVPAISSDTSTSTPTPTPSPSATPTPSPSATPTTPPTSTISGVTINVTTLTSTEWRMEVCMNASTSTIRFEGSAPIRQLVLNDFSGVRNSGSLPLSMNYTYNSCAAGGNVSSWAGRASEGYAPGQALTLTATFTHMGSNFSATKTITIPPSTATPTPSPTPTTSPTPTPSPTPTTTPTPTPTPTQVGLGGYAVVHPNGRVCGVIVATSSDPFGNGGVMPIEYMGCPVGSRIVFQTNPSPTGNVAGWHGENVTYNGSEFVIKNSISDSATIQTVIQGGVATDSSGRVWDTGSGATIRPGTSPVIDTSTVISDTSTVTSDTKTATNNPQQGNSSVPAPLTVKISIPDSSAVVQIVNSLTSREVEAQLVAKAVSKTQSMIQINTEFTNSLLQISATKRGSKPIALSIQTNSKGDARVSLKTNLAGYSVILKAGAVKLDTDRVQVKHFQVTFAFLGV